MAKVKKPNQKPNLGGHPTDYDADFHNPDFIRQSKQGKNIKQIAASWDLSRASIYNWAEKHPRFFDTVQRGKELCEAWYINIGRKAMIGKATLNGEPVTVDVKFFEIMTRNVCGWSKDSKLQITGKDDGPVQIDSFVDLVKELSKKSDS